MNKRILVALFAVALGLGLASNTVFAGGDNDGGLDLPACVSVGGSDLPSATADWAKGDNDGGLGLPGFLQEIVSAMFRLLLG